MNHPLDQFAAILRMTRIQNGLTQQALAAQLGMSVRTIIQAERCKSNPKFETVVLLARALNISLDAIVFSDQVTPAVPKTVSDFFAGKSEAEAQQYIALCRQIEQSFKRK